MARPSSIKRLPQEVRERLNGWIRDESVTQIEAARLVNELLAELYPGHPPVSRRAVSRYDLQARRNMDRVLRSRDLAKTWIANLGSQPGGDVGFLVIETLKTLSLEVSQALMDGSAEIDAEAMSGVIDQLNKLALAAQRLERSAAESERRDRQIREEARKQALQEAAEAAAEASGGLTAETTAEIKRKILGIAT